ncbi:hypothetical protein J6590_020830 [Homalodisca vitripennis]|nr:hypothetical protein J6590_020830 [Homalodisca vitripennis]
MKRKIFSEFVNKPIHKDVASKGVQEQAVRTVNRAGAWREDVLSSCETDHDVLKTLGQLERHGTRPHACCTPPPPPHRVMPARRPVRLTIVRTTPTPTPSAEWPLYVLLLICLVLRLQSHSINPRQQHLMGPKLLHLRTETRRPPTTLTRPGTSVYKADEVSTVITINCPLSYSQPRSGTI